MSRNELLTSARAFCDSVFLAQLHGTRPDARIVLEKTPNHRMQSALQAELYPDACAYVHIIRDGRDATSSQRENWKSLTKEFANPAAMARAWADEVRDIRTHFSNLAYLELRYEDIVSDTPTALGKIFDHFGLPHDRQLCEAAADFGRAPSTPTRSTTVGVRQAARRRARRAERGGCRGNLLTELGYADAAEVANSARLHTPATVALDAQISRGHGRGAGRDLWHHGDLRLRRKPGRARRRP